MVFWGARPAESIVDSIQTKGYIRTFAPLAALVFGLGGAMLYLAERNARLRDAEDAQGTAATRSTGKQHMRRVRYLKPERLVHESQGLERLEELPSHVELPHQSEEPQDVDRWA